MKGEERRAQIIDLIRHTEKPLSGSKLAEMLHVSRQVIVQDIALLRASDYDIISTSRGYLLNQAASPCTRIFKVSHKINQIEDELQTIVDAGGKVLDVFIEHSVYGRLQADLSIYSRMDIKKFMANMESGSSSPLSQITSGEHFHTVQAYSDEILDDVENALEEKKFLV
jgi:hypothetical protein